MNEPQVWTLIGLMAASFFGVMGLMSTMFTRVIKSEIQGVRSEIGGLRNEMNARFDAVDQRFDGVDKRLDGMDKRIDNLDQDVQYLMKREIDR